MARKTIIETDIAEDFTMDSYAKENLVETLKKYKGKRVRITIEDARDKSPEQRCYLRGVVYPAMIKHYESEGDISITGDSLHRSFCEYFLPEIDEVNPLSGEIRKRQKTTSDLKMSEMADFISNVILWVEENLGIKVPSPDEQKKKGKKQTNLRTVINVI